RGYAYDYLQILVTRNGASIAPESVTTCKFTVPLSRCRLPGRLLEALEKARALALRWARVDFQVLSVALARPEGDAEWRFRFYDSTDLVLGLSVSGDGMRVSSERRYDGAGSSGVDI